jgi:hypothetical protein
MPPNDKMPWWRENPLFLKGPETKQAEIEGVSNPEELCAAMYARESDRVLFLCLTYPSHEETMVARDALGKHSQQGTMVGLARSKNNSVVVMLSSEACPDREAFATYFREVTTSAD